MALSFTSFRKSQFSLSQYLLCHFRNIFNHPECAAHCEYEKQNETLHQVCTTLIGYDDLIFTMPGTNVTAKVESGEFWELSCSTKLQGEVFDFGVVMNGDGNQNITDEKDGQEIDFSLDIMCCDPEDDSCDQCTTINDTVPIIKIGPNSKADSSKVVTFSCSQGHCFVLSLLSLSTSIFEQPEMKIFYTS